MHRKKGQVRGEKGPVCGRERAYADALSCSAIDTKERIVIERSGYLYCCKIPKLPLMRFRKIGSTACQK